MKREMVVFSVMGGLLWAATGISVLAVTFFDDGSRGSKPGQVLVVDRTDPGQDRLGNRSRDEETSAPLCETVASDQSPDRHRRDRVDGSSETWVADGGADCCWDREVVSLLRLCLLLT